MRSNRLQERNFTWPELLSLIGYCTEAWCLGWDFNMTKSVGERFPEGRMTRGMRKFNNFIDNSKLIEVPLLNGKFTWSREGRTASRSLLDRFLVSFD